MEKVEKKEQLLLIDPPTELKFRGPFYKPCITTLKLTNPTDSTILFKIKTTAPRKYCVRPNFGVVEPQTKTYVEICLHPQYSVDSNEKNKHKFMVQSFVVPEGSTGTDHEKLWRQVKPEQLMDSKLKCVFEMTEEIPIGDQTAGAVKEELIKEDNMTEAQSEEKTIDKQIDFGKITSEVQYLRSSESQLRQENLKLKEQIVRLRIAAESQQKEQSTSQYQMGNPYSPPQIGQQPISVMHIIAAVVLAILGVLLGKYFL